MGHVSRTEFIVRRRFMLMTIFNVELVDETVTLNN